MNIFVKLERPKSSRNSSIHTEVRDARDSLFSTDTLKWGLRRVNVTIIKARLSIEYILKVNKQVCLIKNIWRSN